MFTYFIEHLKVKPFLKIVCQFSFQNSVTVGTGVGWTVAKAKKTAKSEAVERYIAKSYNHGSNGFAVHPNKSEAVKRAILELIERNTLIETWGSKGIWKEVDCFTIRILNYLLKVFNLDFKFRSFAVRVCGKYTVLFSFLDDPCGGIIFDSTSCLGTKLSPSLHLKNFLNATKMLKNYETAIKDENYILPKVGQPIDHLKYYAIRSNKKYFYEQISELGSGKFDCKGLDDIKIEEIISPVSSLYAFRAYNEKWTTLSWGRISLSKSHLHPHPLS